MCLQNYFIYKCGCRDKGDFQQCTKKYDNEPNLKCHDITVVNLDRRNYCEDHLIDESKAETEFTPRGRNQRAQEQNTTGTETDTAHH